MGSLLGGKMEISTPKQLYKGVMKVEGICDDCENGWCGGDCGGWSTCDSDCPYSPDDDCGND